MINNGLNPYDLFKIKETHMCAGNPIYFLENYMKIQTPTDGVISFNPYDSQRELLHTYATNKFVIALLPRQTVGKSTCAAGYLLWKAMFTPDFNIIVGGHSIDSARDILRRIRITYEHLPSFLQIPVTKVNQGSISFSNGSLIITQAINGRFGRGFSASLIYLDEFAFVRRTDSEEAWHSLCPILSMGSDCIIVSSNHSNSGMFGKIWDEANKGLNRFKAFTI